MKAIAYNPCNQSEYDALLDKDVWLASDVGLSPAACQGAYYLPFSNVTTTWLKKAAMKFVRLQAATRSFSTCRGYIRSFNHLDSYLQTLEISLAPNNINRALIVDFIRFLSLKGLSPMTRGITLINIRLFYQVALQEEWLNWPAKPIIFDSDLPRRTIIVPRYISNEVLVQLKMHLNGLTDWMQRFVIILMETGRRISEVCHLNFNCLEKDNDGDWFLRVNENKLKRVRLIPISKACVDAVMAQQEYLRQTASRLQFLFPGCVVSKSPTVSAPHINRVLNKLAVEKNIIDTNGVVWKFSSHQFRHTIGTQMINSGVPQVMVQHYLGHESPEMTARYAHIHNETMKAAFTDYQEKLIDIQGKVKSSDDQINARWLKKNIMTQALPNGLCALPLTQQKCPHANACLTCAHFRTSKQYLKQHKSQLDETAKVIENAKQNGWQRIVEMNTEVASNLKLIISTLEN
ncbi:transposase [Legionella qingyii]|uniref:Transposase n=1 Tax=Legionella qingyii TaxID=2184757 RepID=A0A317TXE1_9GAMM|nr:tyrosine-type recombinase/integrase [Legionella qingyii]PWY54071.1 transposase [Legionella qingyii]RUR19893.1 transposase [Legionella qingyii]RUR22366.1 transposase [Legionella qingyii]